MAIIVPKTFTKTNVDILRAKKIDYDAQAALARQRYDAAIAINDPALDGYIAGQQQLLATFTAKAAGQQAQVDACVTAGVDK